MAPSNNGDPSGRSPPADDQVDKFTANSLPASNPATMGRAAKTVQGRAGSLAFINCMLVACGLLPIEQWTESYVAGDKMEDHFFRVMAFMVSRPIPALYKIQNGKLLPANENSDRCMGFDTIQNHLNSAKLQAREKFPNHSWWPNSTNDSSHPDSYSNLLKNASTEHRRNSMLWKSNGLTFGTAPCIPIYLHSLPNGTEDPEERAEIANFFGEDNMEGPAIQVDSEHFVVRIAQECPPFHQGRILLQVSEEGWNQHDGS